MLKLSPMAQQDNLGVPTKPQPIKWRVGTLADLSGQQPSYVDVYWINRIQGSRQVQHDRSASKADY